MCGLSGDNDNCEVVEAERGEISGMDDAVTRLLREDLTSPACKYKVCDRILRSRLYTNQSYSLSRERKY